MFEISTRLPNSYMYQNQQLSQNSKQLRLNAHKTTPQSLHSPFLHSSSSTSKSFLNKDSDYRDYNDVSSYSYSHPSSYYSPSSSSFYTPIRSDTISLKYKSRTEQPKTNNNINSFKSASFSQPNYQHHSYHNEKDNSSKYLNNYTSPQKFSSTNYQNDLYLNDNLPFLELKGHSNSASKNRDTFSFLPNIVTNSDNYVGSAKLYSDNHFGTFNRMDSIERKLKNLSIFKNESSDYYDFSNNNESSFNHKPNYSIIRSIKTRNDMLAARSANIQKENEFYNKSTSYLNLNDNSNNEPEKSKNLIEWKRFESPTRSNISSSSATSLSNLNGQKSILVDRKKLKSNNYLNNNKSNSSLSKKTVTFAE